MRENKETEGERDISIERRDTIFIFQEYLEF